MPVSAEDKATADAGRTVSAVIATYNRRDTLLKTLASLQKSHSGALTETIVVDNASQDGTAEGVRVRFPGVRLIKRTENTGVDAYNVGATQARGTYLLILDDDACPQDGSLRWAVDYLQAREGVGAVALHPRHPRTGVSEWPFLRTTGGVRSWPLLLAGFVVRREAWNQAGGYEPGFFLYVNDTDLALKLLSLGWEIHCDPEQVVWHDSPTAIRRPVRWFELATRNRVWLARRHLREPGSTLGASLAWAEAHFRAGLSAERHRGAARGALQGWREPPPPMPDHVPPAGRVFWRLVGARLGVLPRGGSGGRG